MHQGVSPNTAVQDLVGVHDKPTLETVQAFVNELIEALNHADVSVRANAAEILGMVGEKRATSSLCASLDDPDAFVRERAAYALKHLGDTRALVPLTSKLNDEEPLVRRGIVLALGKIGGTEVASLLCVSLLHDPDSTVRSAAAEALGELKLLDCAESLRVACHDPSSAVRTNAAEALRAMFELHE